jgi:xylulokinase
MRSAGVGLPAEFRASGGGTKSPLWSQVVADVLGVPLATTATAEGAAYGAALLGTVAAGWFATVPEAAAALVQVGPATEPGQDDYSGSYASFRRLYPALREEYRALAREEQVAPPA